MSLRNLCDIKSNVDTIPQVISQCARRVVVQFPAAVGRGLRRMRSLHRGCAPARPRRGPARTEGRQGVPGYGLRPLGAAGSIHFLLRELTSMLSWSSN